MPCIFLPLILRLPCIVAARTKVTRRTVLIGLGAALAALVGGPTFAAPPAGLAGGGVATG